MLYHAAATTLAILHAAFIVFVAAGALLVLRWRWVAALQLPAAIWGAAIEIMRWDCPLTRWENLMLAKAGESGFSEGFVAHHLFGIIYPNGLTRGVEIALALFVVIVNSAVYCFLFVQRGRPARPDFSPAWYARGPHVQTIWGRLVRSRRMVKVNREEIETPDGDILVLDHLQGTRARFLLMHGLEGSSNSVYIQGLLSLIARRGYAATAINFRSCARDPGNLARMLPNRTARFYHSGETSDFDFVVRTIHAREPGLTLVACGASLGGNALLKWLGEHPGQDLIRAAATLSVPYDLGAGAKHLERGMGRVYVGGFLRTLKAKVKNVTVRFSNSGVDAERAARARTFREFDDVATAPLHGFADADDYYARASSIHFLSRITTPTLCISSDDDPFLPRAVLDRVRATASPPVELVITRGGGHVGFVGGLLPWKSVYWAEELVVAWLTAKIEG